MIAEKAELLEKHNLMSIRISQSNQAELKTSTVREDKDLKIHGPKRPVATNVCDCCL